MQFPPWSGTRFAVFRRKARKRARIIKANAEFDAARKLREAAVEIMKTAASLELRRTQMPTEIGAEQNTMTVVMMLSEFVEAARALAGPKS
jgi:hypothetical protein